MSRFGLYADRNYVHKVVEYHMSPNSEQAHRRLWVDQPFVRSVHGIRKWSCRGMCAMGVDCAGSSNLDGITVADVGGCGKPTKWPSTKHKSAEVVYRSARGHRHLRFGGAGVA
jgi:hypothetical protein